MRSSMAIVASLLLHAIVALALLGDRPPREQAVTELAIMLTLDLSAPPAPLDPSVVKFDLPAAEPPPPVTTGAFATLENMLPPVEMSAGVTMSDFASKAHAPAAAPTRRAPVVRLTETGAGSQQAQQDYVLHVVRKLAATRIYAPGGKQDERGVVVARLTVGRQGELAGLSLAKDSGSPGLDRGVLDTIRRAAPFAPLPAAFAAATFTFMVPIDFARER